MAQLRHEYDKFTERQAEVIVVGPESAEAFRSYFKSNNLPFVGIPDPEHSILRLFGQKTSIFKLGRMPAQMIIDKDGILKYVHYGHDMTDIPQSSEIIELLDQMNGE